ncbi:hypothetical protein H4R33_003858 [Dimargaris cristalligena]|nr:hypothetical protein H4R33_003858 [Dimargaris cristalligena]
MSPKPQSIYEQFERFDFNGNTEFQLVQAKWFYYNKLVEPFNLADYLKWKKGGQQPPATPSHVEPTLKVPLDDHTGASSQLAPAEPEPEQEPPKPQGFAEICDLILAGKPVPGIRDILETLSDEPASEAKLPPRRKPWEAATNAGPSASMKPSGNFP